MTDEEFLRAFGQRVRAERARRGMSRRLLAHHAGISERYITQLESGKGNISILLLRHVADALGLPLTRLVDEQEVTPELPLLRQFLSRLTPAQVKEAHASLQALFASDASLQRNQRIAFIGLRGAGKSTLGAMLAKARGVPFFELDREIERLSGSQIGVILEMYGQQAYRRYELQALQELLNEQPAFVLATGGSLVSETETFELLLRHCFTVWIQATPASHMVRVMAQGDYRPMKGSEQAMDDLRRILDERAPLYARADVAIETPGTPEEALEALMNQLPERAAPAQ
jgi:XRE family transcriptional regulator, aerobic/anaerobic benzoate catabolism transcriptional regulator